MKLPIHSRVLGGAAISITVVLGLSCALLPRGLTLTAISDLSCALLMLSALLAFAANGRATQGRTRLFWMLQVTGWSLWLSDQLVWVAFDLFFRMKMPAMYPADVLLFQAGAPMLAGLLLRPHLSPSERSGGLGILDFLLLLFWWLYIYVFFVVCWQYVSPNQSNYDRSFDLLYDCGAIILMVVLAAFWRQTSGRWRKFYAFFGVAVVFNAIAFAVLNNALEREVYFAGSWYDIPYTASFAAFTLLGISGRDLSPGEETHRESSYGSWVASLAMLAVLSLPVIAVSALLDHTIPPEVARFRILLTLGTMFAMAFLIFLKHHRLNRELKHANDILEEASLTDPLTGIRNRRYFSATIEADVSQSLRSYSDHREPRTRDLVFYLIDADNFKEINDNYGHDVGDRVLVEMSQRISSAIRHSDVLLRWGGEEFLIVSRYTDRREAEILASRVLTAVGGAPFVLRNPGEALYRTCSIGWAAFPWLPSDAESVSYEEVLSLADSGLRRAKQGGKNRAVGVLPGEKSPAPSTEDRPHPDRLDVEVLATAGPVPLTK
ncbi:MAG TPA: GGDEF domain-containing protein [Candidatus Sulfotelmatobacter sp.]